MRCIDLNIDTLKILGFYFSYNAKLKEEKKFYNIVTDIQRALKILFLNKKLHTFGIRPTHLCSFCNLYDETPYHMFYECDRVKSLWPNLVQCFQNNLIVPTLTPQTAIFGYLDSANNDSILKTIKSLAITFY